MLNLSYLGPPWQHSSLRWLSFWRMSPSMHTTTTASPISSLPDQYSKSCTSWETTGQMRNWRAFSVCAKISISGPKEPFKPMLDLANDPARTVIWTPSELVGLNCKITYHSNDMRPSSHRRFIHTVSILDNHILSMQ